LLLDSAENAEGRAAARSAGEIAPWALALAQDPKCIAVICRDHTAGRFAFSAPAEPPRPAVWPPSDVTTQRP